MRKCSEFKDKVKPLCLLCWACSEDSTSSSSGEVRLCARKACEEVTWGVGLEGSGEMLFIQEAGQRKEHGERGRVWERKGVSVEVMPGAATASPLLFSGESAYTFHIRETGAQTDETIFPRACG